MRGISQLTGLCPTLAILIAICCARPLCAAESIAADSGTDMRFEPSWRKPADCGPASLYVLMRLLGRKTSAKEVLEAIPINPESGCTLEALREKSAQLGCPTTIRYVDPSDLSSVPCPFIAHYNGSLASGVGHFLVVVGYSPQRRQFRTLNTEGEFLTWTSEGMMCKNYSGYVLVPQERIEDRAALIFGYELIAIGGVVAIWALLALRGRRRDGRRIADVLVRGRKVSGTAVSKTPLLA
jgi:Peptidase C39 family